MDTPFFSVVAHDKHFGIGKHGHLPWHLPKDLAYFKTLTTTTSSGIPNVVIMGRKTWESIPERFRPLPQRFNIVLSSKNILLPSSVGLAHSLNEALKLGASTNAERLFVIGGGQVFKESFSHPHCRGVYVTDIDASLDCDTFLASYSQRFSEKLFIDSSLDQNILLKFFKFTE